MMKEKRASEREVSLEYVIKERSSCVEQRGKGRGKYSVGLGGGKEDKDGQRLGGGDTVLRRTNLREQKRESRETLGVGGDHHLREVLLPSRSRPPPPSRRRVN